MEISVLFFIFIIGLFVGSFLNVVIMRWGTRKSFVFGRSMDVGTGTPLPWYDLVPILSFVWLRGRSRFSGKPLSRQYPVVEILTGVLFSGIYWKLFVADYAYTIDVFSITLLLSYLAIISILIVIAFYDLRTKIIPNLLVYAFILLSGLTLFMHHGLELFTRGGFLEILAGPILVFPFAFLWFVSRGAWMGYGDAKLAWGIGWFLGLLLGISAVILSFWIGAIISLALIGLKKLLDERLSFLSENFTIKSEVPFAPFLVVGTLIVFYFNINVLLLF